MGLMDTLGKLISPGEGAGGSLQDRLTQCVLEKFQGSQGGGLAGLLEHFRARGLGDTVQSWISNGPNQPITPEQVSSAMGPEWLRQLASRVGLSPDALAAHLSEALPKCVDKLTPEGKLPETPAS
jgi:uncharacterized protein YidB (DUF937 family)